MPEDEPPLQQLDLIFIQKMRANQLQGAGKISNKLAPAYKAKSDLDKAIEIYERLTVSNPENREGRLIRPENYYELAKCYE